MYAAERHQRIVRRARSQGRVKVQELAEYLDVTPETVRRDLAELARVGVMRRIHGGAVPVDHHLPALRLGSSTGRPTPDHERIAVRALDELRGSTSIALSSGATTACFARVLPEDIELTVVTPALAVAGVLASRPNITLHVLGGIVREPTLGAMGAWTVRALSEVFVDVAFIAPDGLTAARGLTAPDPADATVQRSLMRAASRTVLLADRQVVGHVDPVDVASLDAVDLVITDAQVVDRLIEDLESVGTPVVRA